MTLTSSPPITLTLTEQEADIMQSALCQYRGPYRVAQVLLDAERSRAEKMVDKAMDMATGIQDELFRRHHERHGQ